MKHTPGPWFVDTDTGGRKPIMAADRTYSIAHTDGLGDEEEDEANARILANSVELFEALRELLRQPKSPTAIAYAKDVVAKVRGRK